MALKVNAVSNVQSVTWWQLLQQQRRDFISVQWVLCILFLTNTNNCSRFIFSEPGRYRDLLLPVHPWRWIYSYPRPWKILCIYWYSNFGVCGIQDKPTRQVIFWLAVSSNWLQLAKVAFNTCSDISFYQYWNLSPMISSPLWCKSGERHCSEHGVIF